MNKNAVKDTFFCEKTLLNCNGQLLNVAAPVVMGILNITPDSFYAGSRHHSIDEIITTTGKMLADGAAIIDIGGYSTRPDAEDVPEAEEKQRVLPVIKALVKAFPGIIIAIDTFRSEVARSAVEEGAGIINDISGGMFDGDMFHLVAELDVPYILMHIQGTPKTMHLNPQYIDVVKEVLHYFKERINVLRTAGIKDIIIDPGFGFGKSMAHSYALLRQLDDFKILGCPIMAGFSRKSMVYKALDITPAEALNGTTVLNTMALLNGARLLRVHDVKAATEAIKLVEMVYPAPPAAKQHGDI